MPSRLGLGAATLAMLTTTLMGPSTSAAAGSGAPADPSYGAPTVGQCFDMSRGS